MEGWKDGEDMAKIVEEREYGLTPDEEAAWEESKDHPAKAWVL